MSETVDNLVEGLWARLRNLLIALDRVDRLETASEFAGWVEAFQSDDAQIDATSRAWVLRAVHAATDSTNFNILLILTRSGASSIADLVRATHLTRVEVAERVKDLAQVGFVVQSLETDSVQSTRAAHGMVTWIETLRERIGERARAGLTKDNPPPTFHRPISNL